MRQKNNHEDCRAALFGGVGFAEAGKTCCAEGVNGIPGIVSYSLDAWRGGGEEANYEI